MRPPTLQRYHTGAETHYGKLQSRTVSAEGLDRASVHVQTAYHSSLPPISINTRINVLSSSSISYQQHPTYNLIYDQRNALRGITYLANIQPTV